MMYGRFPYDLAGDEKMVGVKMSTIFLQGWNNGWHKR